MKRKKSALRAKGVGFEPSGGLDLAAGPRWLPFLLIVAGCAVYANSLGGAFVLDDRGVIVANTRIRDLSELGTVLSHHRPVVDLSLAVNYAIGESSVTGYHVFNIGIHILAGLTLYGLVRRVLMTERCRGPSGGASAYPAAAIALLWIVHPLQTGSVTYVIQRCESMMGLFYLLTLLLLAARRYVVPGCAMVRGRCRVLRVGDGQQGDDGHGSGRGPSL